MKVSHPPPTWQPGLCGTWLFIVPKIATKIAQPPTKMAQGRTTILCVGVNSQEHSHHIEASPPPPF